MLSGGAFKIQRMKIDARTFRELDELGKLSEKMRPAVQATATLPDQEVVDSLRTATKATAPTRELDSLLKRIARPRWAESTMTSAPMREFDSLLKSLASPSVARADASGTLLGSLGSHQPIPVETTDALIKAMGVGALEHHRRLPEYASLVPASPAVVWKPTEIEEGEPDWVEHLAVMRERADSGEEIAVRQLDLLRSLAEHAEAQREHAEVERERADRAEATVAEERDRADRAESRQAFLVKVAVVTAVVAVVSLIIAVFSAYVAFRVWRG